MSIGGFPLLMDVTDNTSVSRAITTVLEKTQRIDVLVNNAGVAGKAAPLWEQSDDDWDQIIRINLNSVFLCCRAVIGHMRDRAYGRIVNIASIAGKEGNPNMTGYSATKAAVIGFTKSLAKEVATRDVQRTRP
jgi:3-oxoacyl-[acyl-carrier protein] reductase